MSTEPKKVLTEADSLADLHGLPRPVVNQQVPAVAWLAGEVCGGDASHNAVNVELDNPAPWSALPMGARVAIRPLQPAEQQPSACDSLTSVPDEVFAAEFAVWWDEHGQFCRAGGGTYERTFAFEAWRHLYPQLMNLQVAAAEQQPAPGVKALVEALERISNMDSMSYHSLESAKIVARKALEACRDQGSDDT